MSTATDNLLLTVAWFETVMPDGPAYGDPETLSWADFTSIFSGSRREGSKDGPNFVPSRFGLESDGRQIRRKLDRVIARSAVALDVETNQKTGEVPPLPTVTASRLEALGMAGSSIRRTPTTRRTTSAIGSSYPWRRKSRPTYRHRRL